MANYIREWNNMARCYNPFGCPFYYICTWKNKEVKIFISANFC